MGLGGGDLHSWAELAAQGLEFAGVGVMLLGLVAATGWGVWRLRGGGLDAAYTEYRRARAPSNEARRSVAA